MSPDFAIEVFWAGFVAVDFHNEDPDFKALCTWLDTVYTPRPPAPVLRLVRPVGRPRRRRRRRFQQERLACTR